MTTPSDQVIIPTPGFDPIVFWMQHKAKIIAYAVLIIAAIGGFAAYQISVQNKIAAGRDALAQASTADDYRAVIQNYPGSVVAGNATLLLSEKLRDEKKYDDAVTALQAMINNQPEHPLIDAAWLSLASTYVAQEKQDLALNTYQQIVTKYADRFSAPQALLGIADIQAAKGNIEDAKRSYQNVKSQFPDSEFANEALRKLQLLKK